MSSFFEKQKTAQNKISSGNFAIRENPLGEMAEEKPYHVMYSDGFPGYFIYIVLGDHGHRSYSVHYTWWGFDFYGEPEEYSPYYRKPPPDYEYSLSTMELVPWLNKYYGFLPDVEDYQYLLDIMESAYSSPIYEVTHAAANKTRVLKWLTTKIDQFATPASSFDELAIKWHAPHTQLVELVYTLDLAGVITPTKPGGREGMVERLGKALGVEATSPANVVASAIRSKRDNARRMPLLTKLMQSFARWLDEEK
jgi:hypothetical protein